MAKPPEDRDDFEIAIICALQLEADAVVALFDRCWEDEGYQYGKAPGDTNAYTTGAVGPHNVVLAHMPGMGKGSAASVASSFRSSFGRIKLALVVGICGGVPILPDGGGIFLGDVIISTGIIQYDFGRKFSDRFVRKNTLEDNLGRPNREIQSFLAKLRGNKSRKSLSNITSDFSRQLCEDEDFPEVWYPGALKDKLYEPSYRHKHHDLLSCTICTKCENKEDSVCEPALGLSCSDLKCHDDMLVQRQRLPGSTDLAKAPEKPPRIHFGRIASGDTILNSGEDRDEIAAREEVIAFEMEGAGVWDNFPCVVIKGVCDYADSHKNYEWQGYAAATAVGCMKAFLKDWVPGVNPPAVTTVQGVNEAMTSEDIACLQSLSFLEITNRQNEVEKAYGNTCEWVLRNQSYTKWIAEKRELLWIKGKPGSGKSTLMAFIYRKCLEDPLLKRELNLHFFFHGRGAPLEKTPIGMFRSLLHQLYRQIPSIRSPVRASFKEKAAFGAVGTDWEWQHRELKKLFTNAIVHAAQSRTIAIFIDALDEAGSDIARELAEYFHELNVRLADGNGTAKISISCRHYPIPASYNTSLDIYVEKENHDDIRKYVEGRLSRLSTGISEHVIPVDGRQELENSIVERSKGVFQWVHLVVTLIIDLHQDGEPLGYINQELNNVPQDLGKVYKRILEKVRNFARTFHLMQWVCLAERPLSVTELRFAISSNDDEQQESCKNSNDFVDSDVRMKMLITSWSGGLVEVKHHSDQTTVQFIHQSVNDFLRLDGLRDLGLASGFVSEGGSGLTSLKDAIGQSQDRLCKSCINYLSLEEVVHAGITLPWYLSDDTRDKLMEALPFIGYAIEYWFLHAEKAENSGIPQHYLIPRLGSPPGPTFQTWVKMYGAMQRNSSKCPQTNFTLLHLASISNLRSVVQILGSDALKVNGEDSSGRRPLHYAARWGHEDLMKMLLNAGANIGAKSQDQHTALVSATANGHGKIVELLLSRGADINEKTGSLGNALQVAALQGNINIVWLLLEQGADVNAQGGQYGNALQAAAWSASEPVIRLLLKKGADVNAQGGQFGNALQVASRKGNEPVIRLLLKNGAEVNAQGSQYGNALQVASQKGNEPVVRLLLEKGADVNAQGGRYGNALQAAAWSASEPVIRLLLEKGADVNVQGGAYGNALQAASSTGSEPVIRLLLEKGADVNMQGGAYSNALQAASSRGCEPVVRLLLKKGADVNAQGGQFGDALQAASSRGREPVIRLLLEKGADVNAQSGAYGNALQVASFTGSERVIRLLLKKGADVNAQGGKYGNALQAASFKGRELVVRLLLEKGAYVNAQGGAYGNALQAALFKQNKEVAKLLLEKGAYESQ